MATEKSQPEKSVKIKGGTVVGTVYSQVVSVTITDIDLTLEFVYVNPRPNSDGISEGEVVSRVTLPIEAAKGLSEVIEKTLTAHFEQKGN